MTSGKTSWGKQPKVSKQEIDDLLFKNFPKKTPSKNIRLALTLQKKTLLIWVCHW